MYVANQEEWPQRPMVDFYTKCLCVLCPKCSIGAIFYFSFSLEKSPNFNFENIYVHDMKVVQKLYGSLSFFSFHAFFNIF
jgi:hypothetical protein